MSDLSISSAASLTGATLASNDLLPVLDVSATAGSKGSKISVAELFTGRALSSGTHTALTALGLRSTGAAYDLTLASSEALTSGRTLSFNVGDADRVLTIPATGTAALLGVANVFTANQTIIGVAGTSALTLTGATQTVSNPVLNATQTWNAGAVAFTGIKLNVTNTASAAASLLMDLGVGNATMFNVNKTGDINFQGGLYGNVPIVYSYGYGIASFDVNYGLSIERGNLVVGSGNLSASIGWGTYSGFSVGFFRRADAHVGLGTASSTPLTQTFGGAQGSGTNITGGDLNIGTRGTGTGTSGAIRLQAHAAGSSGSTLGTLVTQVDVTSAAVTFTPPLSLGASSKIDFSVGLTADQVWINQGGTQIKTGTGGYDIILCSQNEVLLAPARNFVWADSNGTNRALFARRATDWIGMGAPSATPTAQTFGGAEGSGSNITGGSLNIGTRGTGTGTGGRINFQTHAAGSSGSTLGNLVTVLSIKGVGLINIANIPTSSSGLSTGDVWSNAGVLTIV